MVCSVNTLYPPRYKGLALTRLIVSTIKWLNFNKNVYVLLCEK